MNPARNARFKVLHQVRVTNDLSGKWTEKLLGVLAKVRHRDIK
jgi:hypothetical protein